MEDVYQNCTYLQKYVALEVLNDMAGKNADHGGAWRGSKWREWAAAFLLDSADCSLFIARFAHFTSLFDSFGTSKCGRI